MLLKSCRAMTELTNIQLLAGNATRWNSVYRAINRAIEVRERVNRFVREHVPQRHRGDSAYNPKEDKLTKHDWEYIERLHTALQLFEEATQSTQEW